MNLRWQVQRIKQWDHRRHQFDTTVAARSGWGLFAAMGWLIQQGRPPRAAPAPCCALQKPWRQLCAHRRPAQRAIPALFQPRCWRL